MISYHKFFYYVYNGYRLITFRILALYKLIDWLMLTYVHKKWIIFVILCVHSQVIVCLCDALSRPQHPAAVRQSPRSSPSFTPKPPGAGGDEAAVGDILDDVEPSDVDVCLFT